MITWTLHGPYSTLGWCIRRRGVSSRQLLTLNKAWTCRRRCWGTIVKIFNGKCTQKSVKLQAITICLKAERCFEKGFFQKNVSGKDAYFQVKSACFFISYRKIPLHLFNHTRLPTRRLSQSYRRFWATHVNRKWTVCILGHWFHSNFCSNRLYKMGWCTMFGFGLQRSFGRNILELLVYYLMPNKCKNLKDTKSSCLSICTSSL